MVLSAEEASSAGAGDEVVSAEEGDVAGESSDAGGAA